MFCNLRFLKLPEWACESRLCNLTSKKRNWRSFTACSKSSLLIQADTAFEQRSISVTWLAFWWSSHSHNEAAKTRTRLRRRWKRRNSFSCQNIVHLSSQKIKTILCNAILFYLETWTYICRSRTGRVSWDLSNRFTFNSSKTRMTWLAKINDKGYVLSSIKYIKLWNLEPGFHQRRSTRAFISPWKQAWRKHKHNARIKIQFSFSLCLCLCLRSLLMLALRRFSLEMLVLMRTLVLASLVKTTPESIYLIGWMRKDNRAARAARTLVQFFDVVCQMTTWDLQI